MINTCWKLLVEKYRSNGPLLEKLFLCALVIAMPGAAPATTIFSNLGASQTYDLTGGNPAGNAFDGATYAEASPFTPAADAIFASVQLALSCVIQCPAPENFSVDLTSDAGDQPGATIEGFTFSAFTLGAIGNVNPLVTATSVMHPDLLAGVQYWITVSAPLASSIAWNWNSTGDVSDQAISADGGSTWFSPSGLTPGAFEVNSTPEPGTALLIGGALFGLALRNRSAVFQRKTSA